jgi:geranylgeranyl diphosphate synthase type I
MVMDDGALGSLRDEVDEAIGRTLDRLAAVPVLSAGTPGVLDAARWFVQTGGKRMRPVLFLLLYRGYAAADARADAVRFAVALELLHSFALIHDDLLDDATSRRGAPTLHRWLEEEVPSAAQKTGRDLALLVGDVLHATAIETAHGADLPHEEAGMALQCLLLTAMQTGAGVYQEVALRGRPVLSIEREAILEIYDRKTTRYTFACPFRMAALLAGAPAGESDRLEGLARSLGTAYQIFDDLGDFSAFCANDGEGPGMHLDETKLMLPLNEALRRATDAERTWAGALYLSGTAGAEDRRRLADLVERTMAGRACEAEAGRLLREATGTIDTLCLDPATRGALHALAGRMRGNARMVEEMAT